MAHVLENADSESRAAVQPPINEGMATHSKVGLISITLITLAVAATFLGVWYRRISFDHNRYKDHTLLADDEEEFGVFNRYSYNSTDYNTYPSWNDMPH